MSTEMNVKETEEQGIERTKSGQCYRPHVDIVELADEILLMADMPGATPDAIDIHFEDGVLAIHAPVKPRGVDNANYLLCEYGVGDFYRTFRVGEQIDSSQIHAEMHDGVLKVHLPKAQEAKPRKIGVTAAG